MPAVARRSVAKTGGWSTLSHLKSTEITAIDSAAAGSVAIAATTGGWKMMPMHYAGQYGSAAVVNQLGRFYLNGAAGTVSFALDLPHGHTLAGVRTYFRVDSGSEHSTAPAVLPSIEIYKVAASGALSATSLGSATYNWVDAATYDATAGWYLEVTGLTEAIDVTAYRYVAVITGESGTGSQSDLEIQSIKANVTLNTTNDFSHWA